MLAIFKGGLVQGMRPIRSHWGVKRVGRVRMRVKHRHMLIRLRHKGPTHRRICLWHSKLMLAWVSLVWSRLGVSVGDFGRPIIFLFNLLFSDSMLDFRLRSFFL